eukprot:GCRY01002893.1.p1 GENE.GCRY01002893.1~~GCRY01002893.1.p1  ORF type:complete len:734 (+),score=122.27 GCRY01002893.1:207-2408(+)
MSFQERFKNQIQVVQKDGTKQTIEKGSINQSSRQRHGVTAAESSVAIPYNPSPANSSRNSEPENTPHSRNRTTPLRARHNVFPKGPQYIEDSPPPEFIPFPQNVQYQPPYPHSYQSPLGAVSSTYDASPYNSPSQQVSPHGPLQSQHPPSAAGYGAYSSQYSVLDSQRSTALEPTERSLAESNPQEIQQSGGGWGIGVSNKGGSSWKGSRRFSTQRINSDAVPAPPSAVSQYDTSNQNYAFAMQQQQQSVNLSASGGYGQGFYPPYGAGEGGYGGYPPPQQPALYGGGVNANQGFALYQQQPQPYPQAQGFQAGTNNPYASYAAFQSQDSWRSTASSVRQNQPGAGPTHTQSDTEYIRMRRAGPGTTRPAPLSARLPPVKPPPSERGGAPDRNLPGGGGYMPRKTQSESSFSVRRGLSRSAEPMARRGGQYARMDDDGLAHLAFSKQPRHVDFVPYSGVDAIRKDVYRGSLGPNLDDEYVKSKSKAERMSQYSRAVRESHHRYTVPAAAPPLSTRAKTVPLRPVDDTLEKALESKRKVQEFSSRVPKPRAKVQSSFVPKHRFEKPPEKKLPPSNKPNLPPPGYFSSLLRDDDVDDSDARTLSAEKQKYLLTKQSLKDSHPKHMIRDFDRGGGGGKKRGEELQYFTLEEEEEEEEIDYVPELLPRHFEEAMKTAHRSVSDNDIRRYEMFAHTLNQARGLGSDFKFSAVGGSIQQDQRGSASQFDEQDEGDDLYS